MLLNERMLVCKKRIRFLICRTGNRALEKCFDKCVESFRSKKLSENERICLENCTSLYLDTVNRVYSRFEEIQTKEKPQ